MQIVADKAIPLIEEYFSTADKVIRIDGRNIDADAVKQADVLIVRSITTVGKGLLHGSSVRYVATATSGTDHIDLEYLRKNGIGFCSAAGSNARSVAEYVLSSLCVLADRYDIDLTEMTAAIIGCGHIGSSVESFFQTLGLECLVYDPPLREAMGGNRYCGLDEVYAADIITLHVPLERGGGYPTWRMIGPEFLRRLKKNVILINTSRGDVVDEKALLAFLDGSNESRVVLDVWSGEPEINMDLLARVNIGTPHIAGYSMESKIHAADIVCRKICEYFNIEYDADLMRRVLDTGIAEITVTDPVADMDAVQMAVLASYDVRTDSSALRQALDIEPGDRGRYFDELRVNYGVRREFNALQVNLSSACAGLADKLAALGFRVSVKH